jgi:LysR family transcriptional repressor of citA
MMDTQNLRTFLVLCDNKNFTKTADQLFLAQSTVTNRIAELEKELGKKLFLRDRKNISLTHEGMLFYEYAKRIVELEETSVQELNSFRKYPSSIKIGSTNTIYECHLSSVLRTFLKEKKDTAVKLTIGHSTALLQMLQDGILDVVYSYVPLHKSGYSCSVYAKDKLVLVTTPSNNNFISGIKKEELSQINYLFCNFALQEVGLFIRELFPPFYQFSFEIDNSTKLTQYLLDGLGYSFLPESLVKSNLEDGSLISIPLLDFETPMINCYRAQSSEADILI